jgi:hypothetical protein
MLDKDDIKAIRKADFMVPFYSPDKYQHPDFDWGIRFGLRRNAYVPDGIWDNSGLASDLTRTIRLDEHNCRVHSHRLPNEEVKSCTAVVSIYDFEVYPTCVLKQLRVGDELGLLFVGCNNNKYLDDANLYHDEVWLQIIRNSKVIGKYPLDDSICANNSARIVRYADSY